MTVPAVSPRHFGTVENPKHQVRISAVGWGEPPEYYGICTCGWHAIPIRTYVQSSTTPSSVAMESLMEQAHLRGLEALPERRAVGDFNDALVQVLHHLNYDPNLDFKRAQADHQKILEWIYHEAPINGLLPGAEALVAAAEEFRDARHRVDAFATRALPRRVKVESSLTHLVNVMEANLYANNRGELSEDVRALMETELEKING